MPLMEHSQPLQLRLPSKVAQAPLVQSVSLSPRNHWPRRLYLPLRAYTPLPTHLKVWQEARVPLFKRTRPSLILVLDAPSPVPRAVISLSITFPKSLGMRSSCRCSCPSETSSAPKYSLTEPPTKANVSDLSALIIPIALKPRSKPWMVSRLEWSVSKYNWKGQKRPVDPTDDLPFDFLKVQREGLPQGHLFYFVAREPFIVIPFKQETDRKRSLIMRNSVEKKSSKRTKKRKMTTYNILRRRV